MATQQVQTGNRIAAAIARMQKRLDDMGGEENGVGLNGKPLKSLHETNRLSFEDFQGYQNAQALAHATGLISAEEAQIVYTALGGEVFHPDWAKGTSLATKMVVTQLIGELLKRQARR